MNMAILPKMEKVVRNAALSHFFLMFGYRIFSTYFPLYMVAKSFSLAQVGYAHFLIYLPIALFAPLVGFLNHRVNPAILTSIGIFGYGVYSLGMISFQSHFAFYLFQVLLGVSAALFFVSSRAILMGSKLENPNRAFAWFYSAPSYVDTFAPAIGAFLIWRFDFAGVFVLSVFIQFITALSCFFGLRKHAASLTDGVEIRESGHNYLKVAETIRSRDILPFVSISFLVLVLGGFNNAFFVLFLKNLGWTQNQILVFISAISVVFLPFSILAIKWIGKLKSEKNVSRGAQIVGTFSMLLGGLAGFLNFYYVFFITLGQHIGGLITGSGRSGLLTTKLKQYPEESAAVDTIFSPLATAIGALLGGLIISGIGFPLIFIVFGGLIFIAGTIRIKT